ncbi:MAG TPA: hypothetical protein VJZ32_08180 [Candidatus Bathyarchaeia archaeon]|nr:hypothetical protein [Candidatus Bathyarchaeia archaeon]
MESFLDRLNDPSEREKFRLEVAIAVLDSLEDKITRTAKGSKLEPIIVDLPDLEMKETPAYDRPIIIDMIIHKMMDDVDKKTIGSIKEVNAEFKREEISGWRLVVSIKHD